MHKFDLFRAITKCRSKNKLDKFYKKKLREQIKVIIKKGQKSIVVRGPCWVLLHDHHATKEVKEKLKGQKRKEKRQNDN